MAEQNKTVGKNNLLPKDIFDIAVDSHELLKLAYNSYLANARNAHPRAKSRGDVRGGGKKPWRQKGTGRARFGSSRNPIWRGGGVAFGPMGNENHRLRLSATSRRVAIKQALSLANRDKKITLIDAFYCPEGKVKEALVLFKKYNINADDQVLLVVNKKDDLILRSTNNLSNIIVSSPTYLNVFNVLNSDKILISQDSLPAIVAWLKKESK